MKKNYQNLNLKEKRKIYNSFVLLDKKFKKNSIILSSLLIFLLLITPKIDVLISIVFILIVYAYYSYSLKLSQEWYINNNIPKNDEMKKFKYKPYGHLLKEQKRIVLKCFRLSEYNYPLERVSFYTLSALSTILFIKGNINTTMMIYLLLIILVYLIYDLKRTKKWYQNYYRIGNMKNETK
ncbi:MAG: hypothetical protein RSA91_06165 [Bacilli bacterium]